jgi:cell wall assembly regulator SMI1
MHREAESLEADDARVQRKQARLCHVHQPRLDEVIRHSAGRHDGSDDGDQPVGKLKKKVGHEPPRRRLHT